MGLELTYSPGQSQLETSELESLRISSISTQEELNEFEQFNIEKALLWTYGKHFKSTALLSPQFVKSLHKRMFGEVWDWAGSYRKTDKEIGVRKGRISTEVQQLLQEAIFWIEYKTYAPAEIAVRVKHRLTTIQPFPNGNGRLSRFMADLLMEKVFDAAPLAWGKRIMEPNKRREQYLVALKQADKGNYEALLNFAQG